MPILVPEWRPSAAWLCFHSEHLHCTQLLHGSTLLCHLVCHHPTPDLFSMLATRPLTLVGMVIFSGFCLCCFLLLCQLKILPLNQLAPLASITMCTLTLSSPVDCHSSHFDRRKTFIVTFRPFP